MGVPQCAECGPRYDQLTLNKEDRYNKLQQVLSPHKDDAGVWIYQNAWFNLGSFDKAATFDYTMHEKNSGVYAFILSGSVKIDGRELNTRDGFGIWDTEKFTIEIAGNAEILLMEVPMEF